MPNAPDTSPECPRCGYDLSGVVASWTKACPLEGVCSECGLRFQWGRVINPALARVPGFVEHARSKGAFFASSLRTFLWTLLPWMFWKRVRLEGRVRPTRAWFQSVVPLTCIQVSGTTFVGHRPEYTSMARFVVPLTCTRSVVRHQQTST